MEIPNLEDTIFDLILEANEEHIDSARINAAFLLDIQTKVDLTTGEKFKVFVDDNQSLSPSTIIFIAATDNQPRL